MQIKMGEHCLLQHILLLQYTPLTAVRLTAAHLTPLYTAGSAPHPPLCRQWTESVRVITQFRPPALARVASILLKFYILPFFMTYIFLVMLMAIFWSFPLLLVQTEQLNKYWETVKKTNCCDKQLIGQHLKCSLKSKGIKFLIFFLSLNLK